MEPEVNALGQLASWATVSCFESFAHIAIVQVICFVLFV